MKTFTSILLLLLFAMQITKSSNNVDASIKVNGISHPLMLVIPANYNPEKEYPLIVGIYWCGGGNATGYRTGLAPMADSLNVIIACPENSGTRISNEAFLQISIDSVKAKYNVDLDNVYLTGMSCNGAATIQFGLKGTVKFKAIFPWDAAVSGSDYALFNFNSKIPVTLATGTSDSYMSGSLAVFDSLKKHGASPNLVLVKGIAHTIAFPTFDEEMIRSYHYINDTNAITVSAINDYTGKTANDTLFIEVKVKATADVKDLRVAAKHSSNYLITKTLDSTYSNDELTLKYKIYPNTNRAVKSISIIEAYDAKGTAIEQSSFKIDVAKYEPTAIEQSIKEEGIYPNPASGMIHIKGVRNIVNYKVTDYTGRVVLKENNANVTGGINIERLTKGVYFISVEENSTSNTYEFIVK